MTSCLRSSIPFYLSLQMMAMYCINDFDSMPSPWVSKNYPSFTSEIA
jgi:hypothetical protein